MRREVPLRRTGTAQNAGVRYGPGSAAHRSARAEPVLGPRKARTRVRCAASGARMLRQPSRRLALEPRLDALDHLPIMVGETFLGYVAEMRGQHDVVERAEGMIDRQ